MISLQQHFNKQKSVLAPMEGVNCASFRVLCKRYGAGLIYTDMVDTKQFLEILKENGDEEETVRKIINPQKDEAPLTIQIGSGEPEDTAVVTQILNKYAARIDLNVGCPLGYMLGRKGGSYMLKHPKKLEQVFSAIVDNATVPVTAKIRSGWSDEEKNAPEIAQLLEGLGAEAIAIHARTRKQRYMARADWDMITKVKQSVSVPVIGNGDVLSGARAVTMLGQTKCDAVMVGRGAQGNPHIFTQINAALRGERYEETTWQERCISFKEFLRLYEEREQRNKLSELQDHAGWWVTGEKKADSLRAKIRSTKNVEELKKVFVNN